MQWQMAVTGRQLVRLRLLRSAAAADLRLFIRRVHRDEARDRRAGARGRWLPRRGRRHPRAAARPGPQSRGGMMSSAPLPLRLGRGGHASPARLRRDWRRSASASARSCRWSRRSCAPRPATGTTSPASARPGSTCRRARRPLPDRRAPSQVRADQGRLLRRALRSSARPRPRRAASPPSSARSTTTPIVTVDGA